MSFWDFSRYTVSSCAAVVLLAGCGGAQPPIHADRALPQGPAVAGQASHGKSWMLPEAKSEDLLYVSGSQPDGDDISVFSYPRGKLVGRLKVTDYTVFGLCADSKGNVFVTTDGNLSSGINSEVYEYAHGGTQPIASLSDPGFGNDCAVDPTTGNLAVANWDGSLGSLDHGSVAIYQGAEGTATVYYDPNIYWYEWCVYDTSGNLYVDGRNEGGGYPLAELPRGSGSFLNITLSESFLAESLEWDAGDLVIAGWQWKPRQATEMLYRVQLSGTEGTVVGTTTIRTHTKPRKRRDDAGQYTLQGSRLIGPGFNDPEVHFWRFPEGGWPSKSLGSPKDSSFYGVAISYTSGAH